MNDALFLGTLRWVPKHLLSRAVGAVASAPIPRAVSQLSIRVFARAYGVDVGEAERPVGEYRTLGEFFTRRLRSGARPIDRRPGVAVSPADGRVLNAGRLEGETLIQAKGRRSTVSDLLGDAGDATRFVGGSWMTVYLSPRNYHRVHHPVEGRVVAARYVPGTLWPVNRAAVHGVDQLFCVNERVITFVDSPLGDVAVVMVGATSVGFITMAYDAAIATNRGRPGARIPYAEPVRVARGDELGIFHLGSTAIVLFADPEVRLLDFEEGQTIRMGVPIARRPAVPAGRARAKVTG